MAILKLEYVKRSTFSWERDLVELPANTPQGIYYSKDELGDILYNFLGEEEFTDEDEDGFPAIPYKLSFDGVKVSESSVIMAVRDMFPGTTLIDITEDDVAYIRMECYPNTFKEWVNLQFAESFTLEYIKTALPDISEWAQSNCPRSAKLFDIYSEEIQILALVESADFETRFEGCLTGFKTDLLDIALTEIVMIIVNELEEADDDDFNEWCDSEDEDDDEDYSDGYFNDDLVALKYEVLDPDNDLF
jgi:hypothetical protein